MATPFTREARWVFIGDSITDCSRRDCPDAVGDGYVRYIRDWLYSLDAANAPQVINTGISGNRIPDLQGRWDADVLAHQPQLVSIKIGINDVWHNLPPNNRRTDIDTFRAGYTDILTRLREAFPEVALVLCEPSVIWPPAPVQGNELLQPYIAVVRELSAEFKASALVPLHSVFEKAREARPEIAWAPDGVHPSSYGHMLIARTWLASLGLL